MRYDRRRPKPLEEQAYTLQLRQLTPRLDALIYNDYGYTTAVTTLLDDVINLHHDAETWKRDDIDEALRLLDQAVMVITAAERRAKAERETRETSALREYLVIFAIVSTLSERFGQHLRTRSGQAYVAQAKALIERAIKKRHDGHIDRAVQYLRGAVTSLRQGEVVEETFGPQLDQLQQWYGVVSRGIEPGSEAHECLERFVAAVDVFNDATARDDTDRMIETFDMAVELLKDAAMARPRR